MWDGLHRVRADGIHLTTKSTFCTYLRCRHNRIQITSTLRPSNNLFSSIYFVWIHFFFFVSNYTFLVHKRSFIFSASLILIIIILSLKSNKIFYDIHIIFVLISGVDFCFQADLYASFIHSFHNFFATILQHKKCFCSIQHFAAFPGQRCLLNMRLLDALSEHFCWE